MMEFMMDAQGDVPPEVREMLEGFGSEGIIAGVALGFVVMLIAGMIFSALGGLLGVLIFRPSSPAPPAQGPFSQGPPPPPPSSVPPLPPSGA